MKACSKSRKILSKFPEDVKQYFLKLDNRCQKHGITLLLTSGKSIYSDGRCGGYFDEYNKELAVAIGGRLEDVLSTAIHEASHLQQRSSKSSIWHKKGIITDHARFFKYLSGEKIYKLKRATFSTVLLEADAERRASKEILKWPHIINIEKHFRKCNAYIFAHWHMMETGKWPKKSCYDKKILAHCPDKLLRDYRKTPWRLKMAFDRYL